MERAYGSDQLGISARASSARGRTIWLIITLMVFATIDTAVAEPRRVLLLHAFGHPYSPWSDIAASFREEIVKKSKESINLFEVSLDTSQVQDPEGDWPFVEYIRARLSGRQPDLIVPVGVPAASFMKRHREQLFPAAPMMIMGAALRFINRATLTDNETGILLDLPLTTYFENILRVRPETNNVAVVVGNSPLERFYVSTLHSEFQRYTSKVNIEWLNNLTFEEMLTRAAKLPPGSAILWFLLSEDVAGVPYSQDRALEAMREVASVPIFGIGDYELGRGIVGGPLMPTQAVGRQAAEVAFRILNGETPSSIKTSAVTFGAPTYDSRELRRWDISVTRLPLDSIVRYREPSVWQRYRWQITAISAVFLAQTLLIVGMFYERRRRRYAEAVSRQRLSELAHMNRSATAGELSASIAHEIKQPLQSISANGSAGLHLLAASTPDLEEAREVFQDIVNEAYRANEVLGTIRSMFRKSDQERVALDVNAMIADVLGLMQSDFLRRQVLLQTRLREDLPLVRANRVQLRQVMLNLCVNATDAMDAVTGRNRILKITTERDNSSGVLITVEDSGPGIDPKNLERIFEPFYTTKPDGMGMGLSICRSIVEEHGGQLFATPGRARGLAMQITLPATPGGACAIRAEAAE